MVIEQISIRRVSKPNPFSKDKDETLILFSICNKQGSITRQVAIGQFSDTAI